MSLDVYLAYDPAPLHDDGDGDATVYWANITHNLNRMAAEADVYRPLWRPDEIGIDTASQLIEPLTVGLQNLRWWPNTMRAMNPLNGWGDYDGLVRFVEQYLKACREFPDATVSVSR